MRLLPILIILILNVSAFASDDAREARMMEHARYCLVTDIVLSAIGVGHSVTQDQVLCRAGELGIAFIGERSSRRAVQELAKLRRYVLDGALGESYTCYVLARGNSILPEIRKLNLAKERIACEAELRRQLAAMGMAAADVNPDGVCVRPQDVAAWMQNVSTAVKLRRKCTANDW